MIIEAEKGQNIYQAAEHAARTASESRIGVDLLFNGIKIYVSPFSNPDDIATIYSLKHQLRQHIEL